MHPFLVQAAPLCREIATLSSEAGSLRPPFCDAAEMVPDGRPQMRLLAGGLDALKVGRSGDALTDVMSGDGSAVPFRQHLSDAERGELLGESQSDFGVAQVQRRVRRRRIADIGHDIRPCAHQCHPH
jgi:hypothetical protein